MRVDFCVRFHPFIPSLPGIHKPFSPNSFETLFTQVTNITSRKIVSHKNIYIFWRPAFKKKKDFNREIWDMTEAACWDFANSGFTEICLEKWKEKHRIMMTFLRCFIFGIHNFGVKFFLFAWRVSKGFSCLSSVIFCYDCQAKRERIYIKNLVINKWRGEKFQLSPGETNEFPWTQETKNEENKGYVVFSWKFFFYLFISINCDNIQIRLYI